MNRINTKQIRIIFFFVFTLIPIMVIILIAVCVHLNTLYILPSEKYSDIGWWLNSNQESIIHSLKAEARTIEFEYTLGGSPAYAGFSIILNPSFPFCDLSEYSELTVRLTAGRAQHFGIIIMTFENGITQFNGKEYGPWRYCQIRKKIKSNTRTHTIQLADLKEPEWWTSFYNAGKKALDPSPLKKSYILQFFFDDQEIAGQKDRIEIEEIAFHSSTGLLWIILITGALLYYSVFTGVFIVPLYLRKSKHNRTDLLTSYRRIDNASTRQKDIEVVKSCIIEKYSDPDISSETVSRATGISQKHIREAIRKAYSMNFKECISWLRIHEAKRLLSETDKSIIDIAFSLGFGSNAYFSSNFKNKEGITPSEYRKKYSRLK